MPEVRLMSELISQPSNAPTRKVAAAAIIGAPMSAAFSAFINLLFGVDIPEEIAAPIGALIGAAVAYFVRDYGPKTPIGKDHGE